MAVPKATLSSLSHRVDPVTKTGGWHEITVEAPKAN